MKNLLQICTLFAFIFLFSSCNKDEKEPNYATKFYALFWDVDTVPVTLPSSALDRTFQIKDGYDNPGGIIGVTGVYAQSQRDTIIINNTGLNSDLKNSILSDTIRGTWFTIITEENRRLRIILDKNEETVTRILEMPVWAHQLKNIHDGQPMCNPLIIYQLPSKKD